jgi:Cohesin domain
MRNIIQHIVGTAALALGIGVMGGAQAAPTLTLTPSPTPVFVGGTLSLSIGALDFSDLYGYQYTLNFDPALFRAVASREGAFLQTAGTTFFDGGVIDNTSGAVSFVLGTVLGPGAGATGSGQLASFDFLALGPGAGTFGFSDALFIDSNLNAIPVALSSLSVTAVPEPTILSLLAVGGLALLLRRRGDPATPVGRGVGLTT